MTAHELDDVPVKIPLEVVDRVLGFLLRLEHSTTALLLADELNTYAGRSARRRAGRRVEADLPAPVTACRRPSPLPMLTEARCIADHAAGDRACRFRGLEGRSDVTVEPKS